MLFILSFKYTYKGFYLTPRTLLKDLLSDMRLSLSPMLFSLFSLETFRVECHFVKLQPLLLNIVSMSFKNFVASADVVTSMQRSFMKMISTMISHKLGKNLSALSLSHCCVAKQLTKDESIAPKTCQVNW